MRIPASPDSSVYAPLFWAFSILVMAAAYVASLV